MDIKLTLTQDDMNKELMIGISGKNLVFNSNNFFDVVSLMTFIPYDKVQEFATQFSQIAEDIQRTREEDLENQKLKYGEDR